MLRAFLRLTIIVAATSACASHSKSASSDAAPASSGPATCLNLTATTPKIAPKTFASCSAVAAYIRTLTAAPSPAASASLLDNAPACAGGGSGTGSGGGSPGASTTDISAIINGQSATNASGVDPVGPAKLSGSLIVALAGDNLTTIDVTQAAHPRQLASVPVTTKGDGVVVQGLLVDDSQRAYIVTSGAPTTSGMTGGVQHIFVYDLSDPTQPKLQKTYQLFGTVAAAAVSGHTLRIILSGYDVQLNSAVTDDLSGTLNSAAFVVKNAAGVATPLATGLGSCANVMALPGAAATMTRVLTIGVDDDSFSQAIIFGQAYDLVTTLYSNILTYSDGSATYLQRLAFTAAGRISLAGGATLPGVVPMAWAITEDSSGLVYVISNAYSAISSGAAAGTAIQAYATTFQASGTSLDLVGQSAPFASGQAIDTVALQGGYGAVAFAAAQGTGSGGSLTVVDMSQPKAPAAGPALNWPHNAAYLHLDTSHKLLAIRMLGTVTVPNVQHAYSGSLDLLDASLGAKATIAQTTSISGTVFDDDQFFASVSDDGVMLAVPLVSLGGDYPSQLGVYSLSLQSGVKLQGSPGITSILGGQPMPTAALYAAGDVFAFGSAGAVGVSLTAPTATIAVGN